MFYSADAGRTSYVFACGSAQGVCRHHVARDVRRALPHVAAPRRVGRDEPRSRLLRRLRHRQHRRGRRARRPRLRVHDRARQRRAGRGDPRARAVRRRPVDRRVDRVAGRGVASARARLAAALARPREGRHAHGDLRRGQRALGPRRQARGQAALGAAVGAGPGGARRARRLPLPHGRAHPRGGAGDPARRGGRPQRARRAAARRRLSGVHDDARLARLRRRQARAACAPRRSPTATSRSS